MYKRIGYKFLQLKKLKHFAGNVSFFVKSIWKKIEGKHQNHYKSLIFVQILSFDRMKLRNMTRSVRRLTMTPRASWWIRTVNGWTPPGVTSSSTRTRWRWPPQESRRMWCRNWASRPAVSQRISKYTAVRGNQSISQSICIKILKATTVRLINTSYRLLDVKLL